ncbi:MAG: GAF domain-containing protein [Cytophagales bacterium]|nr:GAF domain-containing protein [Rhizobacter sp.]
MRSQWLDEPNLFRAIFAAYPDALLLVDGEGLIRLANPAAETLLGYAAFELIGLSVDALVPDSIRPRHAEYRQGYARNPRPRPMGTDMELVAKRRDGSEVMVEISLSPLPGVGPPQVVVAIRGIGNYPRVKRALQRAHYAECVARMGRLAVDTRDPQQLLDQVPEVAIEALQVQVGVIFLLEPNKTEFRVVAGACLLPGETVGCVVPNRPDTPPGFVLSQSRPVVIPDYRLERRFSVPPAYLEAGLVSALAVPLSDRGQVVGMLSVRSREPQRFGDDEVHFLESLSNLLAATLQRVQSEESLNHAQRLESVGQLTGGIAHDFNNLLTVIQGNLQVLEELPAVSDDAYALQLVTAAARASRRGAELTSKLLAFSRRQVLSPSRIEVPALLDSLADMLRRTLDQRIRIEVHTPTPCPPCLADAGQLESALLNIAINARDAMPTSGTLSFSGQMCHGLPPELRGDFELGAEKPDAYIAITVTDTGAGMSDSVKERAFEPFFTTKEAGRGTGLGLSTVYGFVKQSRGAITLTSAPGEGTTVTLYIPRFTEHESVSDSLDGHTSALPRGLSVLLVEDEPEVRAVALKFLDTLGCVVTACASAEQALPHLTADAGFDLLLSDIALGPGMRGIELAREAKTRLPQLAVLLMSGFSAELIDTSQTTPLSWELLAKPYSREELGHAIARALLSSEA